jgi:hypothetical protein
MQPADARRAWQLLGTVNAVTYFADESRQAASDLGLKGFWMGYFAFRSAPMGEVPAGVVTATFFNFHTSLVQRAIPDAWGLTSAGEAVEAREGAAASALRRLAPDVDEIAMQVNPMLERVAAAGDPAGRPLFAANRDLPPVDDPAAQLWRLCTTIREHRGDGHVACLTADGIDGCQAHVLLAAAEGVDRELYLQSRGWSTDDWDSAAKRLQRRGLLAGGTLTEAGAALRARVERRTDELAIEPFHALDNASLEGLLDAVRPVATAIIESGVVPFPNPMGLPPTR